MLLLKDENELNEEDKTFILNNYFDLNYKNMVLKAKDRSTVVTGRTLGHPARVMANKLTRTYLEMEAAGASAEELEKLGVGSLHKATHEGDVENGSVMIGQISGMLEDIKNMLEQLSQKERDVLILRFGLNNDGNKKTLDEIGSIYGVSRERIRQIENRAISKLKKLCKNRNMTSGLKNYIGG